MKLIISIDLEVTGEGENGPKAAAIALSDLALELASMKTMNPGNGGQVFEQNGRQAGTWRITQ